MRDKNYFKIGTAIFYTGLFPTPKDYYRQQYPGLHPLDKEWISVKCCFHDDNRPSLRINLVTGAFRCFACSANGGNIIAFHCQRYHLSFRAAVEFLGGQKL